MLYLVSEERKLAELRKLAKAALMAAKRKARENPDCPEAAAEVERAREESHRAFLAYCSVGDPDWEPEPYKPPTPVHDFEAYRAWVQSKS